MEDFKSESNIDKKIFKDKVKNLFFSVLEKNDPKIIVEKRLERSKYLKNKYPDCSEYVAYHIFIGSTPPDYTNKLDFPEDDSIVKYLESLLE